MDHGLRPALRDRHVQRGQNQLRSQVRLHRPANHPSRVHIKHHRQIQETRASRHVGDVSGENRMNHEPQQKVGETAHMEAGRHCDAAGPMENDANAV
jgi:hypothetical protein